MGLGPPILPKNVVVKGKISKSVGKCQYFLSHFFQTTTILTNALFTCFDY